MQIRSFTPADRPGLLRLAAAVSLPWATDPALFAWKYERPLPSSAPAAIPRLLVAVDGDRIVGMLGAQPITIELRGQPRAAAYGTDLHVDPESRGHGVGSALLDRFAATCPIRIMAWASAKGHRQYLQRDYLDLPGLTLHIWPHRPMRMALRYIIRRAANLPRPRRPTPLVTNAAAVAATIPGCEVEPVDDPTGLDDFLRRCRRRYELVAVRDAATLRWRYLEHPHGAGALFTVRNADGQRTAVFGLAWRRIRGLDALVLADLFAPPADDDASRTILRRLPRMAAAVDADLYGLVTLAADLRHLVPFGSARHAKLCAIALPSADLPVQTDRCYLTAADSDFIG